LIFYPPEKLATPLTRVENIYNRPKKSIKRSAILRRFQNGAVLKRKGKIFPRKTDFRDKKLWALLDTRVMYLSEISAKSCYMGWSYFFLRTKGQIR
jgi:hypothetical protein